MTERTLRVTVELEPLFPQGIQPGGGLNLSFQQVREVAADDALQLAGKLPVYFYAAGAGEVIILEEPEDFLGVDGEGAKT